jgi:hypothetical protein
VKKLVAAGLRAVEMGVDEITDGRPDSAAMAALILSWGGASWLSTMMMPSFPTASTMLPPRPPSSM